MTQVIQPVLVIVDMQPRFSASENRDVINAIRRQIRKFKKNNDPIVVLEYESDSSIELANNSTHFRLLELLQDYSRAYFKTKNINNGGPAVLDVWEYFTSLHLTTWDGRVKRAKPEFVICGVNTNACVRETVEYLFKKKYAIKIIANGCNCVWQDSHDAQINTWREKRSFRFRVA